MTKEAVLDWFKGLPAQQQVEFLREAASEFNWSYGINDIDKGLDWVETDILEASA